MWLQLRELSGELVDHLEFKIPRFALSAALAVVKSSVKSRAGFDLDELAPVEHADRCFIPALFGHADDDDFILKRHSEVIHAKYAGDKNLVTFPGDHNSQRPQFFHSSALIWLQNTMLQGAAAPPVASSPGVMFSPRVGAAGGGGDDAASGAAVAAAIGAQAVQAAAPSFYPSTQERLGGIGLPMAAGGAPAATPRRGEPQPSQQRREVVASEEAVAMLMSMGFGQVVCERALRATGNDAERATDWIFAHLDDDEPAAAGPGESAQVALPGVGPAAAEGAAVAVGLPPAVLVNADGSGDFGDGAAHRGGWGAAGDDGEEEDASLQAALAMSMQPLEVALGSGTVSEAEAEAAAPDVDQSPAVSKNDEFCIKNEDFCIKITQKRGLVYQKRGIVYQK